MIHKYYLIVVDSRTIIEQPIDRDYVNINVDLNVILGNVLLVIRLLNSSSVIVVNNSSRYNVGLRMIVIHVVVYVRTC